MSTQYQVNKPMKYDGENYQPGDVLPKLDGRFDEALIAEGYITAVELVEEKKNARVASAKKRTVKEPATAPKPKTRAKRKTGVKK